MIANRAHTRGFRAILQDVRKPRDWMVVQAGFELTAPFHQISRRVCGLFRAIQANPCHQRICSPMIRPKYTQWSRDGFAAKLDRCPRRERPPVGNPKWRRGRVRPDIYRLTRVSLPASIRASAADRHEGFDRQPFPTRASAVPSSASVQPRLSPSRHVEGASRMSRRASVTI